MSEIKKNIETCRGEDVLAEVSGLPQDPHFGSLVNEALDPLKQQAAAQEGWDGYSEVIEQHKPYTFASAIIQMKSNLLLLLRALWQFPFGTGTLRSLSDDASLRSLSDDASLRSLSDMWQHYITRLSGNETYGIPSRLSSLTDLPSAPLLVADRKICGADVPDGMSIVQMFCCSATAAEVTELTDNTTWDLLNRSLSFLKSYFPNLDKLTIGCQRCTVDVGSIPRDTVFTNLKTISLVNKSENPYNAWAYTSGDLHLPALESFYANQRGNLVSNDSVHGDFIAENVETIETGYNPEFCNTTDLVRIYAPKLKRLTGGSWGQQKNFGITQEISKDDLTTIIVGYGSVFNNANYLYGRTNVIHIEFRVTADTNVNLAGWNPTNVLADADKTATFLSNFRTYIALRLADNGSGKTLTLSQAVYDAIKDESHLFVFDEGTMTIYAYLTNIKHWTVTK